MNSRSVVQGSGGHLNYTPSKNRTSNRFTENEQQDEESDDDLFANLDKQR
jgi:hypothetical protein